jgi:hypothetical protein
MNVERESVREREEVKEEEEEDRGSTHAQHVSL